MHVGQQGDSIPWSVCGWVCYATGGKRIFLEKLNFVGSWWSASRKSLKPHKYFVSSFRRWLRFGLVTLFADHLFLPLFFCSCICWRSRALSSFLLFLFLFIFIFFSFFFRSNRHGFALWFSNCRPLIADSDLSVFFFVKTCRRLLFDRSRHLEEFFQNTRAFCTNCTILNFVYKNLYEGLFINLLNYKCPNNKIYIIRMI